MSNLELIETLCDLVERQNDAIRQLAVALENCRQLTESEVRMCESVERDYAAIIGSDELQDF